MMNIIILTTKQNGAIIINMTNGIEANAYVPDKAIVLFLFHVWLNLAIVIKHWSLFGIAQKTTGLKLENYYFFTFTFSRPEVGKLLLFYFFTFSRPEVGKLLLFYFFSTWS